VISIISALVIVLASETHAYAYLDAGTGSMVIQLLLGGLAGLAVLVKLSWRRLRDRFRPDQKNDPSGR
jgi:hypothetical protein